MIFSEVLYKQALVLKRSALNTTVLRPQSELVLQSLQLSLSKTLWHKDVNLLVITILPIRLTMQYDIFWLSTDIFSLRSFNIYRTLCCNRVGVAIPHRKRKFRFTKCHHLRV